MAVGNVSDSVLTPARMARLLPAASARTTRTRSHPAARCCNGSVSVPQAAGLDVAPELWPQR